MPQPIDTLDLVELHKKENEVMQYRPEVIERQLAELNALLKEKVKYDFT
jgi:hypothetical protein